MIWFILGALFGVLLMAVFNMSKEPPIHITCKDCEGEKIPMLLLVLL